MKTKAAVFYKAHTPLSIEEVEMAPLKPQDVLVKIAASGVCHSDLHPYHGLRNWPVPMVMGLTGGRGVDYAFEVVGKAETYKQTLARRRCPSRTCGTSPLPTLTSTTRFRLDRMWLDR